MTKKKLSVVFCIVLSVVGAGLIALGIVEGAGLTGNDRLFSHMILTIPGILGIGSGLFCLTRKSHRSAGGFVVTGFLYTALGGFLIECIAFQFIYFGLNRPQPKLTIPAVACSLCAAFFYMLFHIAFCILYGKAKKQ